MAAGQVVWRGKIGGDLTEEEAQAARLTILNSLAILRQTLGSLDEVTRIPEAARLGALRRRLSTRTAWSTAPPTCWWRCSANAAAMRAVPSPRTELPLGIAVEIELVAEAATEA